jgi:hydroxyacylglutathione hydrolase
MATAAETCEACAQMLWRKTFPVGALGCNCTVLADLQARSAVVIDPGDEVPRIVATLAEQRLQVVAIVHTHAHIDHVGGTTQLARATGAPTYLHADDTFLYDLLPLQAQMLGLPPPGPRDAMQQALRNDMVLSFGAFELGALHTPGHTPGSMCFEVVGQSLCFTGDTLFAGGIGRTDLPGGDATAISRSIRERLYTLDADVEVVCGHGKGTRIGFERQHNPFVRA